MFYLLETPVGLALFKKQVESTDIPILCAKLKYSSIQETVEFYQQIKNGILPDDVNRFISSNLIPSSTLNIPNQDLFSILNRNSCNFKLVSSIDDSFKILNKNPFKWFDISKDLYCAMTIKLAFKMASTNHEDLVVSDILTTIEELDKSINNRIMRAREWYSLHFPELNGIPDHMTYMKLVLTIGIRSEYLSLYDSGVDNTDRNDITVSDEILFQIKNSMGCDISIEDMNKIKENIKNILKDIEYKSQLSTVLRSKTKSSFPNLFNLIGEILTAKLIRKAGSINCLSQSPSSTIQIFGSEKAFHEAVKSQSNTPKYGFIYDSELVSRASDSIKGKIARLLANKIALCSRLDSSTETMNDGKFGSEMKMKIEKEIEKLEERKNKIKKGIHQKMKKVISVKDYDNSKDFKK